MCVCVRARLCARGEKFLTARIILRADRLRALVSFFLRKITRLPERVHARGAMMEETLMRRAAIKLMSVF